VEQPPLGAGDDVLGADGAEVAALDDLEGSLQLQHHQREAVARGLRSAEHLDLGEYQLVRRRSADKAEQRGDVPQVNVDRLLDPVDAVEEDQPHVALRIEVAERGTQLLLQLAHGGGEGDGQARGEALAGDGSALHTVRAQRPRDHRPVAQRPGGDLPGGGAPDHRLVPQPLDHVPGQVGAIPLRIVEDNHRRGVRAQRVDQGPGDLPWVGGVGARHAEHGASAAHRTPPR